MISTTIESFSQFIGTSSGVGIASIGLASSGGMIDEKTLLPLSLFIGGVVFSVVMTWKHASAKSDLRHRLDMIEKRLERIENST